MKFFNYINIVGTGSPYILIPPYTLYVPIPPYTLCVLMRQPLLVVTVEISLREPSKYQARVKFDYLEKNVSFIVRNLTMRRNCKHYYYLKQMFIIPYIYI